MRTTVLFAALASIVVTTLSAQAGRLDIAVLRFADKREAADISAALQQVDLVAITDSDRTETNVRGLRGGDVLFAQSLGLSGGNFSSSTRLGVERADVTGTLNGSTLSVKISILEGVKIGLRKFQERVYEGRGSVGGGVAQIIAISQGTNKSHTVVKNRSQIITYNYTSVVVAKYTP